jgi:hypothetical protein
MPQTFLHGGQDLRIPPGLAIDDTVRMQAGAGERRREEIPAAKAPQHGARQARQDPGHEQACQRGVLGRRRSCLGTTIDAAGFRKERHARRCLKPPHEVARLFGRYPEAVARSLEIADRSASPSMS